MFSFFKQYHYAKILIAKLLELYSFYSLRSVLVLIFVSSLNFADIDAFAIYTTFVICGDIISIIGAYFGDRLLTTKISWIIGTVFSIFGYFYAFLNFDAFHVSVGLIFAGIGLGLSRANSNVIINDYIQRDVSEELRHNHNGIFHVTTIFALMLGFIINGFILKYFHPELVFLISGISVILGLIVFIYLEGENLKTEIKDVFYTIDRINFKKIFLVIAILIGAFIFSATLYYTTQQLKDNFFMNNIKILIVMLVIISSIYLIKKSKSYIGHAKQSLLSLLMFVPFYLVYLSFEKQLDMGFTLFLSRNVDRSIFGFELPPSSIVAIFTIGILITTYFFFKKSIYSYFRHHSILIFGFSCSLMYFILNYIGCFLTKNGPVNILFPVISLLFLAVADVVIVPRMYSLIRNIPSEIKSTASSLMMLSHGSGFYIAGLLAKFVALDKNTDSHTAIHIYQNGFLTFIIINFIVLLIIIFIKKIRLGGLLLRK